jgi:hypothetical protein
VLNADSATAGLNTTRHPSYQQYRRIRHMELKVTSALSTSQQSDSKAMEVNGTATIYPFLIPNEGDMFIARLKNGHHGIFQVTSSERKSIFEETCHVIEYQLIDDKTITRTLLDVKSVVKYEFILNFLKYGQNPLLIEEEVHLLNELHENYVQILEWYFKEFLSKEYMTIIAPAQPLPCYDHFLVKATKAFFNVTDSPNIRKIKLLNCDGDDIMHDYTLWDVLINRNPHLMKSVIHKAGLVSARSFSRNPMLEGVYHSGVVYVVYPMYPHLSIDDELQRLIKPLADAVLVDRPTQARSLKDVIAKRNLSGNLDVSELPQTSPLIHPVNKDNYYIFSKAFYTDDSPNQSLLEQLVGDYLHERALDIRTLITMCQTYHSWTALERFYYVPIILMLIKSAIRAF